MNHKPGPGTAPSERALFQLWDAVDKARERSGEQAAQDLAVKALKAAVEPPEEKDKQP